MATVAEAKSPLISVSQFVEHPALNAVFKGVKGDLKDNGVEVESNDYIFPTEIWGLQGKSQRRLPLMRRL